MRRMVRWVKRVVLVLLALGVVAIIAALIALHTAWGRELARARVESALKASFPGGARIGELEGSVFGTLTVHDIQLDGRDGKPFIVVGTAKLRLALAPLISKIARIESLELEDVVIDQHARPAPPPEPGAPGGPPSQWTVEVPDIVVRRARVVVATVEIGAIDATASLSLDGGVLTGAARITGTWQGHALAATTIASLANGIVVAPFVEATFDSGRVLGMGLHGAAQVDGVVSAWVPAALANTLAGVTLPGDATLVATARAGNVDAIARVSSASVRVLAQTDLDSKAAQGFVIANITDGARLDRRFVGSGLVTASLDVTREHVRGFVTLDGVRPVDPQVFGPAAIHGRSLIAIDATLSKAWLFVESGFDLGGGRATAIADLTRKDGAIAITKSTLVATVRKVGGRKSAARKTDLSIDYLSANVRAKGELWPNRDLHVTGMLGGDDLRFEATSVSTVDVRFDATRTIAAHLDVTGVRQGAVPLGAASLDAHGSIDGDAVTIAIDSHTITTPANGVWSGSGGKVVIDLPAITIAGLHTGNGDGKVVASSNYATDTKDLDASIEASNVALVTLAPQVKGTVGAVLKLARRGGRWSGSGRITGQKVEVSGRPVFDVDGHLDVNGRRVAVHATTTGAAGSMTLVADVDGPEALTDVAAWRRLDRRAVREIGVTFANVDGKQLGASGVLDGRDPCATGSTFRWECGSIDGRVSLSAKTAVGELHVRGIPTRSGPIDGDLTLSPLGDDLVVNATARLEAIDTVDGAITLGLPAHPFDPQAWQLLGRGVLRGARLHLRPVDLDRERLAKLHVITSYTGRAEATANITEGAKQITTSVDVTKIAGGILKRDVDVHAVGTIDERGARVTATATSGAVTLLTVDGQSPIDLDHRRDAHMAPLTGTIEVPTMLAKDLVAVIGRDDVSAGTVAGKITVAGTVAVPTFDAKLVADGVTVPASLAGRPPAKLDKLVATLHWGGAAGAFDLGATEAGGGLLHLTARGRPDELSTLEATFEAAKFDLAPFTAFAPGVIMGTRGVVDASLVLKGFDPDTGNLRGMLQVHNGRVPLSPLFGTLRAADIVMTIANHHVTTTLEARLGKGTLSGTGTVALVGSTPSTADLDLTLKQISLIQAFQPTIDAKVVAKFVHQTRQWTGDVVVSNGHITVSTAGGAKLLDAGLPDDMTFVDNIVPVTTVTVRPPPSQPWLIAGIEIKPTTIDVIEDELEVRGGASGNLTLSLGQGSLGLDGTIDAQRGDIDLLGTRSQLDHGSLVFDGTVDPLVNVRIIRELTDLTITADITGRLSDIHPELSSDSGDYTQGELYSFFLGGQPSGDRSEVGQAAAAAGAGLASSIITRKLNKLLPIKLAFNYETATASSSEAIRVGYWISRRIFIAGRSHIESRVDENANEAQGEFHLNHDSLIQGTIGDRGYDGADYVRRWHW